jgi:hypothetical protein
MLDIIQIHNEILDFFKKHSSKLSEYKETIRKLESLYETYKNEQINNEILNLQEYCRLVESFNFYTLQVTPLLRQYKNELSKPVYINFMGERTVPDNTIKIGLEKKFTSIVTKIYKDIDKVMQMTSDSSTSSAKNTCVFCSSVVNEISTNNFMCVNCGLDNDYLQVTFSYKDTERINISTKYKYDRCIHFRDCINQFQGKQNSTIDPDVYKALYKKINEHNLLARGINKEQQYFNVTKQHIYMFLKETGYSKHYEDINLIYHSITGKQLDDIAHLEEKLMDDFNKLSKMYDEIYIRQLKINRKSFINTQYVLYQLLKRHKYKCKEADFNFLKTTERKCFHDEVCGNLFKKLGWNFSNCF